MLGCGDRIVGTSEPREQRVIIEDRISDESYRRWRFDLPEEGRNFRLSRSFVVTSGGSRDINAIVVDKDNYALYSVHRVTKGKFDLSLDKSSGPYYFVLDNTFSYFIDKWVEGYVTLRYEVLRVE